MSEHVSAAMIDRYQRQLMSPAELLSVDGHLSTCESCCEKLSAPDEVREAFVSVRANLQAAELEGLEHLSSEQFTAFVDDALGDIDREILQGHLEVCSPCTLELRELLAFKAALANQSESTTPIATVQLSANRWQKFVAFWGLPSGLNPLSAAGAAAAVILFVGTGIILWLGRETTPPTPTEIAQATPSPVIGEPTATPAQPTPSPIEDQPQSANNANTSIPPVLPHGSPRQITPPLSQQPVIALNDGGGRITFDGGKVGGVEGLPPTYQQALREALATGRVSSSADLSSVSGREGVLMGGRETGVPFPILHPVGKVIRSDRPDFRWSPLEGASSYTVSVYDSNYQKVAGSPELQASQWSVPEPLERGRIYRWEVSATRNGEKITSPQAPAPEAKFKVLEKARTDELDEAERRYSQSHLMLGLLYAREGLLDDAEREFQSLVQANPDSPVARTLLKDVQARRAKR